MMRCKALGLMMLMAATSAMAAQERVVDSRVVSVGLFKNGLAVVTREVALSGAGTYLVSDVPTPVHGTFWIENEEDVEVRVTMRDRDVAPRSSTAIGIQEQLAGRKVMVHFREQGVPPTTGKVVSTERPRGDAARNWQGNQARQIGRFLILETKDDREYIDLSTIARVTVPGPAGGITERRPVLLLTVKDRKSSVVRMSYLAKGLSWAPSYRVDISDEKDMTIELKAIIKNELGAFRDAEVFLISGFPSIRFGHVTSPLSLHQTWATFFQQLNAKITPGQGGTGLGQQAVLVNTTAARGLDLSATPSGEGPDIHYQPVGKRTMAEGDSILLRVAAAKTNYDRIVEWIVPDTRTADGRYDRGGYEPDPWNENSEKYRGAVWDALRFKNPFSFPMTTGAAIVVGKGKFLGEGTSFWVNEGEENTLHITKALSIRTRLSEQEEPDSRKVVHIRGTNYDETTVKGELMMNNHRNETVAMVIRRRFSGELLEATDHSVSVLREEGVWSVNRRNELTWFIGLEPGEERILTYRYEVLVRH